MYQHTAPEPPLARPTGVRSAYGQVLRQTMAPRDIEYRVFAEINAELVAADGAGPGIRAQAVDRNRQLWINLSCAAADTRNALPEPLRASIISLGIWVIRESSRLVSENAPFGDLVEINQIIMRGLVPAMAGAPPCP